MRATQAALETTTAIPCGDGAAEIPDSTLALEPADTSALIERLKALADATRLRMLTLLAAQPQPLCVCDITSQFNQRQPTISHHLRILRQAGLIACEKRGVWAYYWATDAGRRCLAAARALA
jgi:ArsR family transcriptional regulator